MKPTLRMFLAAFMIVLATPLFAENAQPAPPVPGTRMTEAYVQQVGRLAYFWAWPMVNMHNRRVLLEQVPEPGLMGGIVPVAPPNTTTSNHKSASWPARTRMSSMASASCHSRKNR